MVCIPDYYDYIITIITCFNVQNELACKNKNIYISIVLTNLVYPHISGIVTSYDAGSENIIY